MDKYERLQELIRRFEDASVIASGGKTRAKITYGPAYVNCNANLKPEGKMPFWFQHSGPPAFQQSWGIAYYYTSGEPHSSGGIIGTTIDESIGWLELHFKTWGG
jgi:hypothetical protein